MTLPSVPDELITGAHTTVHELPVYCSSSCL